MTYRVKLFRLSTDGHERLIAEQDWDANQDTAEEIGEYAGGMIGESIECDVSFLCGKDDEPEPEGHLGAVGGE